MKTRVRLGKILVVAGLLTLAALTAWRFYVAAHRSLGSFDDQGAWLLLPFLGTISLGAGLFLLALSGGPKDV